MTPLKLNLACGSDYRPGWKNLDVVDWPGYTPADVRWDARTDAIPFPDGSATEVYAGYLLLHLNPKYHARVLSEIRRVLAPYGLCVFGEVDMAKVMARWLADPFDKSASELIWGEQGDVHGVDLADYDKHCWGFTEEKLRRTLTEAGFTSLRRISVHHADVWYELTIACTRTM